MDPAYSGAVGRLVGILGDRLRGAEARDIVSLAQLTWEKSLERRKKIPALDPTSLPGHIPMNTFPFFRGVLVKGQHFLDPQGKQKAGGLTPGDTVDLKHEPTNQHDPYAVGVFKDGIRVGYVQKEVSAALAWLLAINMPLAVTVIEIGKAGNLVINVLEHKP